MAPAEERRDLDHLLEAFQADSLTVGDISELSRILTEILSADMGSVVSGRTILAGDKIAAAIVLRVLENLVVTTSESVLREKR